jgi:hypothetical protein
MTTLIIIVFEIKIVKFVSSLGIYLFVKPFSTGAVLVVLEKANNGREPFGMRRKKYMWFL